MTEKHEAAPAATGETAEVKKLSILWDKYGNWVTAFIVVITVVVLTVVAFQKIFGSSGGNAEGNSLIQAADRMDEIDKERRDLESKLRAAGWQSSAPAQAQQCATTPAAYYPAPAAEPQPIQLTTQGQRSVALTLTTVEWSAPVLVPTKPIGVSPVRVGFNIVPHSGFIARVWDDECGSLPYRDASVPAGGALHVSGLRKIQFRGMADGQQMTVTVRE